MSLARFAELRPNNWVLALALAIIVMLVAIPLLPPAVSFWVSGAMWALFAVSLVVNAWGRYKGGLLVAPAIALLFIMNIFPLMWSLGLSFFAYRANRMRPPVFVGLDNYEKIVTDPVVWQHLHTTAVLAVITVIVQMVTGFLLAMLFAKQFPLRRYLLILVLTPMMLSFVAVGAFFRYYYEPTFGLLSQFIRLFTGEAYILLSSTQGAMAGIVFADAWMWSPFVMLLVLAGLVSVPKYLYEAAEIDRASEWFKFRRITLPLVWPLLLIAVMFRAIEAFRLFDLVYILTGGGPGGTTETLSYNVYKVAFFGFDTGRAAAYGILMVSVVILAAQLYLRYLDRLQGR